MPHGPLPSELHGGQLPELLALVVGVLLGGLAIYAATRVLAGEASIERSLVTALAGALAWALVAWIPLVGGLLALVAWIGVINWRTPGGWIRATLVGVGAWAAAVVAIAALELVGLHASVVGVPGV